jgi:hypothetical protein
MKKLLPLLLLLVVTSCKKDETVSLDSINDYIIVDPYEFSDSQDIQFDKDGNPIIYYIDTVFYEFKEDGMVILTLHDYELKEEQLTLKQKLDDQYKYQIEGNRIIIFPKTNTIHMSVSFGKVLNQWEVLKLNADTMIVDLYQNKTHAGHCGFSVMPK